MGLNIGYILPSVTFMQNQVKSSFNENTISVHEDTSWKIRFSQACPTNTYNSVHALVTRAKTSFTYTNNSSAVHPEGCAVSLWAPRSKVFIQISICFLPAMSIILPENL